MPDYTEPAASEPDAELSAMELAVDALSGLDEAARGRVLHYLNDRYGVACASCGGA